MKKVILPLLLFSTLFTVFSCQKETPCTNCESWEECIDGQCQTPGERFQWGDLGIIGDHLYVGFAENNTCIDTVVFGPRGNDQFGLYINPEPSLWDAGVFVNKKYSDTEYFLFAASPACYHPTRYANIYCSLYEPDSVRLKFLFSDTNSEPGVHIDSTTVMLYQL